MLALQFSAIKQTESADNLQWKIHDDSRLKKIAFFDN